MNPHLQKLESVLLLSKYEFEQVNYNIFSEGETLRGIGELIWFNYRLTIIGDWAPVIISLISKSILMYERTRTINFDTRTEWIELVLELESGMYRSLRFTFKTIFEKGYIFTIRRDPNKPSLSEPLHQQFMEGLNTIWESL